jgi:L-ribulokinase
MPIKIHKSEQTCALGAAMFGATAAGLFPKVEDAMNAMGQGFDQEFKPNPSTAAIYANRYKRYSEIGGSLEQIMVPKEAILNNG